MRFSVFLRNMRLHENYVMDFKVNCGSDLIGKPLKWKSVAQVNYIVQSLSFRSISFKPAATTDGFRTGTLCSVVNYNSDNSPGPLSVCSPFCKWYRNVVGHLKSSGNDYLETQNSVTGKNAGVDRISENVSWRARVLKVDGPRGFREGPSRSPTWQFLPRYCR